MENNQNANSNPSISPVSKPELNLIGREISGCVILEKISQGGMGTVFKAKHKALDRIVCVKVLNPNLAKDKKTIGLFLTEARAVAELDHQNIVQVYNVGKEKGLYFIVMSFIDGEPLSHIVRKRPNLPIGFVVDTFIGVLKGLQAAHQKGIVHRDIKPSNILITKNLQPKIVDFGIAKKVDQEKGFTKTTELAGTAYFLSPEQASGKEIDVRADLYSLGASMFYVITGKYPYTGKNTMEIIQKHINAPIPDLSQYRKGIPAWIIQAIQKLMTKNPDERFQSAADALAFFQKGRADELLNTGRNISIDDEIGFTVGREDMKTSPRKNAQATQSQNLVIPSLGQTDKGVKDVPKRANPVNNPNIQLRSLDYAPEVANTKTDAYIIGRKKELAELTSITNTSVDPSGLFALNKMKFLLKAFLNTIIASLFLIAGVGCFLKLGVICSASIGENPDFLTYFIKPWQVSPLPPGQILWGIVCAVYALFVLFTSMTELLGKISFYALLLAFVSYVFGVTGLVSLNTSVGSLMTFSYLPVLSFLFVFMALVLDDYDVLPFYYRFLTIALFACSLMALYKFFAPPEFLSGELITTMLYSLVFTLITLAVMPFMRDSVLVRMATMVVFVFAAITIWLYQGAGNAYAIINHMPSDKIVEYKINTDGLSEKAIKLLENDKQDNLKVVQSYVDLNDLEPKERRRVFTERLRKNYSLNNKDKINSLIWNYALTESFIKFKHDYKDQNIFFFILIMGVMYGIFMFIIKMLAYREEKWNLI